MRKLLSSKNLTSVVKQSGGYRKCKFTDKLKKLRGGAVRSGSEFRPIRGSQSGHKLRNSRRQKKHRGGAVRSSSEFRPIRGQQGGTRRKRRSSRKSTKKRVRRRR